MKGKRLAGAVQLAWMQGEQVKLHKDGRGYTVSLLDWKNRPVTCPHCQGEVKRRKWRRACCLVCFCRLTGMTIPETLVKALDDLPKKVHRATVQVPWWRQLAEKSRKGWQHVRGA